MAAPKPEAADQISEAGIPPEQRVRLHCLRVAADTVRGTPASVPGKMIVDRAREFELFVTTGASGCAGDGSDDDLASRPNTPEA